MQHSSRHAGHGVITLLGVGLAAALIGAALAAYFAGAFNNLGGTTTAAASGSAKSSPRGAGGSGSASGSASSSTSTSSSTTTTTAPPTLKVVSTVPSNGASTISGAGDITVAMSAPVKLSGTTPKISPNIPGSWATAGDNLVFTPAGAFAPDTTVTVTLPAGLPATDGASLSSADTFSFKTGIGSVLRLQQLLGQLGYLPLSWTPAAGTPTGLDAAQKQVFNPPAGTFTWKWKAPPTLAALWHVGQLSAITKGAVMAFQSLNGLTMNGVAGQAVWNKLVADTSGPTLVGTNTNGYTYALASKVLPETLTVWHNGQVVSHTLANTGIPQSPTANGTFPVYERLRRQVMRGTNPNGTKYADPVSWVAYFNGGDAVHYIPRARYGFPQSLGCVEVAYATGKTVWPYLTYGSLVTVQ